MLNLASKRKKHQQQIVKELKGRLQSQQDIFTKAIAQSDAAVKASFIVAEKIARASKCFSEGTCEVVHAEGVSAGVS